MLARSKQDKSRVTAEIFQQVRALNPPGRFLHKIVEGSNALDSVSSVTGWWLEIDDAKSLAKISQALREGAPAFRALHGGKIGQRKKHTSSQRKVTNRKQKKKDAHDVYLRDTRKARPEDMEVTPARATRPRSANERELGTLFPTANNNVFSVENHNGNLSNSYPLVHMGDYNVSLDEVALSGLAIPSPQSTEKIKASVQEQEARSEGKCSTPKLQLTLDTPFVSPGFSPCADAKAAQEAVAFLSDMSPTSSTNSSKKKTLQRVYSLSISDGDVRSVGSFHNPFENDSDNNKQEAPPLPELDLPHPREDANVFPPPHLTQPSPDGLSFGRIGSFQVGSNLLHNISRHRLKGRKHSNIPTKGCGSISNNNTPKRKSIG